MIIVSSELLLEASLLVGLLYGVGVLIFFTRN